MTVLGGGSWGTTVAHLCAHNTSTTLWARDRATVESITGRRMNDRYLPGFPLHPELRATTDLEAAMRGADIVVVAVPTEAVRTTAVAIAERTP